MFFRRLPTARTGLPSLLEISPFQISIPSPPPSEVKGQTLFDVVSLDVGRDEYAFGLRIGDDLSWLDRDLALQILRTVLNHRMQLDFALFVASLLVHSDFDFVAQWILEMRLTGDEARSNAPGVNRLFSTVAGTRKKLRVDLPWYEPLGTFTVDPPVFLADLNASGVQLFSSALRAFVSSCVAGEAKLCGPPDTEASDLCILRLSQLMESTRQHTERNMKLWSRFWSNVVVDNAPWDPSRISATKIIPRWKRDFGLFGSEVPIRMKRNRNFNSHIDASVARDTGTIQMAENQLKIHEERRLREYRESAPPEILAVSTSSLDKSTAQIHTVTGQEMASYDCELVKIRRTRRATFEIFSSSARISLSNSTKTYVLLFTDFKRVLMRKRYHRQTGIEIFLRNGRSYLLHFPGLQALPIIRRLNLPDEVIAQRQDFASFFQSSGLTQAWLNDHISNFEYLLAVNLYAGRSFNDASQYPFFPWTLNDFGASLPDLENPASYRPLNLPIGAVGEERLAELVQRLHDMQAGRGFGYLYSSYAVCPLSLYLWLVRMEPFTSLHIEMQSQKFDHGSRIFSSVPDAYSLVTTHFNDYRELIPEFYFQPEFLRNDNGFDLGKTRSRAVNHVLLPEWANDSESEFVYVMRKAFESDYVTEHLCEWIDLMFGFRQSGPEAEQVYNIYHPDIYESAWTPETVQDPGRRNEIEATMCHIGEIPARLFTSAHPKKSPIQRVSFFANAVRVALSSTPVAFCAFAGGQLLIFSNHILARFELTLKEERPIACRDSLSIPHSDIRDIAITADGRRFAVLSTAKLVILSPGMPVPFSNLINVSSVSADGEFLAVVSDDATFNLIGNGPAVLIPFYGDAILCCALSKRFGIAVAGTVSGSIVICSLFEGTKVRVVALESGVHPLRIMITEGWGLIVTLAAIGDVQYIFVHNVNGRFIRRVELPFVVTAWSGWASRKDVDYLIVAAGKRVFWSEAFYARFEEPFHRCAAQAIGVKYLREAGIAVIVQADGQAVLLPLSVG
jgi:hypothetical protein